MPKRSTIPSYCRHKASGLAYVTIPGRGEVYLGKYDSDESKIRYAEVISEQFGNEAVEDVQDDPPIDDVTIDELVLRYVTDYVKPTYITKDGKKTDRFYHFRLALRPLRALYGHEQAKAFGPRKLKRVRDRMIKNVVRRKSKAKSPKEDKRPNRKYINEHVRIIQGMFKWAVSEEQLPVSVYQALMTVESIRKGRDRRLKESKKIKPAPTKHVEAVLSHVSAQIAAMIQLQQLTGMRPDEVTIMRPRDIDQTGDVWIYTPQIHKLEHHEKIERIIPLGPKAQAILAPWLDRDADAYLFSPKEVVKEKHGRARRRRLPPQSVIVDRAPYRVVLVGAWREASLTFLIAEKMSVDVSWQAVPFLLELQERGDDEF